MEKRDDAMSYRPTDRFTSPFSTVDTGQCVLRNPPLIAKCIWFIESLKLRDLRSSFNSSIAGINQVFTRCISVCPGIQFLGFCVSIIIQSNSIVSSVNNIRSRTGNKSSTSILLLFTLEWNRNSCHNFSCPYLRPIISADSL